MARGKRSSKVKVIKSNERDTFKALWRTGVATTQQLERAFGIKGKRLESLAKSGYLSVEKNIVRLNKEGISYCKNNLSMQYQYKSAVNKLGHDIKLMEGYINLKPDVRELWRTEGEVRAFVKQIEGYTDFTEKMVAEYGSFKGTPDAVLMDSNGKVYAIECVTKNYKEADIAQKQQFADKYLDGIRYF